MAESKSNEPRNAKPGNNAGLDIDANPSNKPETDNNGQDKEIICLGLPDWPDSSDPAKPKPTLPEMPKDDYYKGKIAEDQLGLIDAIKTKDENVASEKKESDAAKAEETHLTAQDAYKKAERERDSATKILNIKSINKKTELLRVYNEKLISLTKDCAKKEAPDDRLAICVAELNKSLADEDINHLKQSNEIKMKFVDAENIWRKAEADYEFAICETRFTETQAIKQADVVWRKSISKLLEQCK